METFLGIVKFLADHYLDILGALIGILTAVMSIAMLIPGEQPEKALKGIIDFLTRFSRK